MEGFGDTGLSHFDRFGVFRGERAVFERGGEEINDGEGETLLGLGNGRLGIGYQVRGVVRYGEYGHTIVGGGFQLENWVLKFCCEYRILGGFCGWFLPNHRNPIQRY